MVFWGIKSFMNWEKIRKYFSKKGKNVGGSACKKNEIRLNNVLRFKYWRNDRPFSCSFFED